MNAILRLRCQGMDIYLTFESVYFAPVLEHIEAPNSSWLARGQCFQQRREWRWFTLMTQDLQYDNDCDDSAGDDEDDHCHHYCHHLHHHQIVTLMIIPHHNQPLSSSLLIMPTCGYTFDL